MHNDDAPDSHMEAGPCSWYPADGKEYPDSFHANYGILEGKQPATPSSRLN